MVELTGLPFPSKGRREMYWNKRVQGPPQPNLLNMHILIERTNLDSFLALCLLDKTSCSGACNGNDIGEIHHSDINKRFGGFGSCLLSFLTLSLPLSLSLPPV